MDARHFDRFARTLSEAGTRRGLLGLLATLPVLGGLVALLDREETDAKGRRKRRKKAHKHGKGRHRGKNKNKNKKKCKPRSQAQTCSGKCGPVRNNCKKTVDCGSCDCDPPCDECFTCQGAVGAPGACVPQAAGTLCGDATTCVNGALIPQGNCDGSGSCQAGTEVSCAPYLRCDGVACATTCGNDDDCVLGSFCNAAFHCAGAQDDGQPCTSDGQCASGFCVDGVCCDTACDGACEACNLALDVGACTTVADGATCGSGNVCCAGSCENGICCDDTQCPSETAPNCEEHECTCGGGAACAGDPELCCAGTCVDTDTDPDHCGVCGTPCSGTTPVCVGSGCVACSAENPCPAGCCASDDSCPPGTADTACGAVGGACVDCGPGRRCVGRQCICDGASCPNGCCDAQGQCQVDNNLFCGAGGVACSTTVSCLGSQVCDGGECVNGSIACAGCLLCVREVNGHWHCARGLAISCAESCTSSSTCDDNRGNRICAEGDIAVSSNVFDSYPLSCNPQGGIGRCTRFIPC